MEDFDFVEDEYSVIEDGLTAADVSLDAMSQLLMYYPKMLAACIRKISELTGSTRMEVKEALESDLDLQGVLEDSMRQITASKDVLKSTLEAWGQEIPDDFE